MAIVRAVSIMAAHCTGHPCSGSGGFLLQVSITLHLIDACIINSPPNELILWANTMNDLRRVLTASFYHFTSYRRMYHQQSTK